MQAYSNPKRENEPHALPDIEVWEQTEEEIVRGGMLGMSVIPNDPGWYWWTCSPGCLPDSDPIGPFSTQELALEDARSGLEF